MTMHNTVSEVLDVSISLNDALAVELVDRRPESREFFAQVGETYRRELARDVWQVGLRAIQGAQAAANAARLEDVGRGVLVQVERQLEAHMTAQARVLEERLRRYFDPKEGQFMEKLEALFKDGGELTRLLRQHTGPGSTLQQVLSGAVGPGSALMKVLSPTEQDGVAQVLRRQIEAVLQANEKAVQSALDPLVATSAAGRFVANLQAQLREAGTAQEKRLAALTVALDANNEGSLLNRLLRETQEAQRQVLAAVNPSDERSLLAPLKRTIEDMLARHQQQQMAVLEAQGTRQAAFEKEIREVVTRMQERKDALGRGIKAGKDFEETVFRCASALLVGGPYEVDFTAHVPAPGSRKKVGDVVVTFNEDSAYRGARVVVEAKFEAHYTTKKALAELAEARQVRAASVGVFVLSVAAAPKGFPAFQRVGADVLVQWDPDDPSTDAYLHAALLLALALAARLQQTEAPAEAEELARLERMVGKHVERMQSLQKKARTLSLAIKEIGDELHDGLAEVQDMAQVLGGVLRAVRAEHAAELDTREPQVLTTTRLDAGGIELAPAGA